MDPRHAANRTYWNTIAQRWKTMRDDDGLWQRCHLEPALGLPTPVLKLIETYVGSLAQKTVGVLASGDNHAVFALAGLGASVTSVDISEEQLAIAAHRASDLGLPIEFIAADITRMPHVPGEQFDLVCASNGVLVWLADLKAYFSEVQRVLKPGGYLIFYDVHPFQRPWEDTLNQIVMQKPYFGRGPYTSRYEPEEAPGSPSDSAQEPAPYMQYEFHWTLSDILNAVIASGMQLCHVDETPSPYPQFWMSASYTAQADDTLLDWHVNPRAGLPVWLTIVAKR